MLTLLKTCFNRPKINGAFDPDHRAMNGLAQTRSFLPNAHVREERRPGPCMGTSALGLVMTAIAEAGIRARYRRPGGVLICLSADGSQAR
jgi:hypothetical protein